jgi:hypothetical protein
MGVNESQWQSKEVNGSLGESIVAELCQDQLKQGRAKSADVGQKVYVEGNISDRVYPLPTELNCHTWLTLNTLTHLFLTFADKFVLFLNFLGLY